MKKQFLWMLILSLLCVWTAAGADEPANQANLDKIEKEKALFEQQQKLALEKEMQAAREADQVIKEAKLAIEQEAIAKKKISEDRAILEEEKKKAEDPEAGRPEVVIPYEPRLVLEVGDDCTDPIVITIDDVNNDLPYTDIGQTTCGRGNTYSETCLGSYDGGEDIIYKITNNTGSSIWVTLTLDADNNWGAIAIDDACPLDASTCLAKAASYSNPDVISDFELENGVDYYIMCDIWPTPNCMGFDLTITEGTQPPDPWNCTDNPPTDKTGGGSETESNDDCLTEADLAQCEYAYCGEIGPTSSDEDYWEITLPNDSWYALHIRVFADDTPNQYAFGGGLDPSVYVYDDDCTTQLLYNGDYNGFFPNAEHWDSQIDPDATGNCFPPDKTLYIKVRSYNTGPYLLIINCVTCEPPVGRCCNYTDPENPACTDVTEDLCQGANDVWDEDLNCTENPCPVYAQGDVCEYPLPITLDVNNEYTDTRDLCPFNDDYRISGGDVIYVFTPDEDLHLVVETCNSPEEFDDYLVLYDEADCGTYTSILTADYGCPSGNHGKFDYEFLNGQTYKLMIDHWEISEPYCGTYTLDIYPYVEPTGRCCDNTDPQNPICTDNVIEPDCSELNDVWTEGLDCSTPCPIPIDCSNPIQVTLPPTLLTWPYVDADQTTCGTGHNYDENTCLEDYYDNGEDILYEITVTEEVTVNIYLTSNTTWTGMAIGTSCPPGPGCMALSKGSGTDESIEILTLPAGTYYLMIDTFSSPDCIDNYTLTIDEYVEPTGACCLQDDQCTDGLTRDECLAIEGARYMGDDTICAEIDCTAEIPTLSEWGMIIFTLLLLSVGTVAVIRRRKSISAKEVARG